MTTHARATSAIYNSQMSGVKMPGDLHVSMLIVYKTNKCRIVTRHDTKKRKTLEYLRIMHNFFSSIAMNF